MKKKAIIFIMALVLSLTGCASGKSPSAESHADSSAETIAQTTAAVTGKLEKPADDSVSDKSVSETNTEQMQSTIVDETLTSMLKPLDSIMVVEFVTSYGYNPTDPVVYWTTMYYYLCLYGPRASGTSYDKNEAYLIVGADVVREVGRVLYGETVAMPPIPDTIARISLHDDGNYYVKNDPRPDCYPEFVSAVKNDDGSYEAIAQLTDVHGKILINHSFHLTPKSSVNNLLGQQYYYTVSSAGVG